MTLPEIRTAIVSTISAAGIGDAVQPHPGRMTAQDLKSLVIKGRACVRVGCVGVPMITHTSSGVDMITAWAAYILTLDQAATQRDETAMLLSAAVASLVCGNVWGRSDLDTPDSVRADNLYSGQLNQRAVALWAVSWRQAWTPEPDGSSLDDLLRVVTTFDLDAASDGEPTLVDNLSLEGGSS